jgi:MFS family permease
MPLLVLGLTGSAAQAGLVGGLERAPYLLLSIFAGALVDRWDRKRVMVLCDVARALALGSVAAALWAGHLTMAQLYSVALLEGAFFTFSSIAGAAALPAIVGRDQLAGGFAQMEMAWSGANVIGPALGGALYQLGRSLPFAADAVTYGLSALSLCGLRASLRESSGKRQQGLHLEIADGLRWLWGQRRVRFLAVLNTRFELALSGTVLALIVLVRRHGAGADGIGLMLALGAAGTTAGYVIAPRIQRRFGLRPVVVTALWLLVGLWSLYLASSRPLVLGLIAGGAGATASVYLVTDLAYRVALIPGELQGRLNSIFGLLSFGVQSISLTLAGTLIQVVSPTGAVLTFAACLLAAALSATFSPSLRGDLGSHRH